MKNLKKIFWHNTLHMTLCTLPFLLAWLITLIFPDDSITKYVLMAIYIISVGLMYYPISVNFMILVDMARKKVVQVDTIIEINPGWKNACFGIKKKYIHETFAKDYHNIFDIYFSDDDDTTFLEFYIKNSILKKTEFGKFFTISYDGKHEIISKKVNTVAAKITYHTKSRIIKDITFYIPEPKTATTTTPAKKSRFNTGDEDSSKKKTTPVSQKAAKN